MILYLGYNLVISDTKNAFYDISPFLWNQPPSNQSASSQFFFLGGGVASRVPWRWRDSYGKTGNFGRVGDKSKFKMYKKAGEGREGDI